jgi:hypothetical protein
VRDYPGDRAQYQRITQSLEKVEQKVSIHDQHRRGAKVDASPISTHRLDHQGLRLAAPGSWAAVGRSQDILIQQIVYNSGDCWKDELQRRAISARDIPPFLSRVKSNKASLVRIRTPE